MSIKDGKSIYLLKAIFELSTFDTSLEEITKTIKSKGELDIYSTYVFRYT